MEDSVRLKLILTAKQMGYSLREIKTMIDKHNPRTDDRPLDIGDLIDGEVLAERLAWLERRRMDVDLAIGMLKEAQRARDDA